MRARRRAAPWLLLALAMAWLVPGAPRARAQAADGLSLSGINAKLNANTTNPRGYMFRLSGGNTLPADWIIQTNERVGGMTYLKAVRDLMLTAQDRIDITSLGPFPDNHTAFTEMFKDVVTQLNKNGRRVTIRFLFGRTPFPGNWNFKAFIEEVTARIRNTANPTVNVYAATIATADARSWNHAKIVAVDSKRVIVGGHNFYAADYAPETPIFDLSMRLDGPAAATAERFTAALWLYACTYAKNDAGTYATTAAAYLRGTSGVQSLCLPFDPVASPPEGAGEAAGIQVLAVAHGGLDMLSRIDNALGDVWNTSGRTKYWEQWGDMARDEALAGAKTSILISQQAILFPLPLMPRYSFDNLTKVLAERLMQGVDVYIVISTPEGSYGSPAPMRQNVEAIFRHIRGRDKAREMTCKHLFLTTVARRTGPNSVSRYWDKEEKKPIGNHAKFFMVDDQFFYIGSQNFYPPVEYVGAGAHQEFGFLIDSKTAAAELRKEYWEPLWGASRVGAYMGGPGTTCPEW